MSDLAGVYNVIRDFGQTDDSEGYATSVPHWVIAVIRLGMPLSFSRKKMSSVTKDVSQGALLRAAKPLVITDDCYQLTVQHSKRNHLGTLSAALHQSDVNYLVEILPGDWVMAWVVNNSTDYESLLERIDQGRACNAFSDGLKFVGRVHDIRKTVHVEPEPGMRTSTYQLTCSSFTELDTHFYYDPLLASKDGIERDLGQWLCRLGTEVEALFGDWSVKGITPNNVNQIMGNLLDLIVGQGPKSKKGASIQVDAIGGQQVSQSPQTQTEAPYAYLIPMMVGKLLGKDPQDASKGAGVLAYADILELVQGVQSYENRNDWHVFVPKLGESSPNRRITDQPMLGTFLPYLPDFANRPLWQVLQGYLNPTINEMFTTLRVNPDGAVVPTMVVRQIPFTTEAFVPDASVPGATTQGGFTPNTRFLTLPRWEIPTSMIQSLDIGRSDSTRFNFVHVYGASAYQATNVPLQAQMINNPPVRDDLDIMRSGIRPYMTTVECWINDQIGDVPGQWIKLIADWTIGSQFTLNGSLQCKGVQSPICVGDNIEFDKVVYHIESVTHSAGISGETRHWSTQLSLTNGMRADLPSSDFTDAPVGGDIVKFPIYPGFEKEDNMAQNPGLTAEHRLTTGGLSVRDPDVNIDDAANEAARSEGTSQLSPQDQQDSPKPKKSPKPRSRR